MDDQHFELNSPKFADLRGKISIAIEMQNSVDRFWHSAGSTPSLSGNLKDQSAARNTLCARPKP
jgi:hypothetical protein